MSSSTPLTGIVFLTVALSVNAVKDGLFKLLDGYYPPALLLWVQLVFVFAVLAPVVLKQHGPGILMPRPFAGQCVRGGLFVVGVGLFYWSLNIIPLADATSMVFVAPFIVTGFSPLLLGEKLGWHRSLAVVVGFIGVIVILRPDLEGNRIGYLIGLAAGTCLGFFYMANRLLAGHQPQLVAVAYTAMIGAVLLAPAVPFLWVAPRPADAGILAGFLVLAMTGQILLISAFSHAPASTLAPFQYSQLVTATLFGVIVFDAFPDGITWIGILLVVAAGLYIAFREGRLRQ